MSVDMRYVLGQFEQRSGELKNEIGRLQRVVEAQGEASAIDVTDDDATDAESDQDQFTAPRIEPPVVVEAEDALPPSFLDEELPDEADLDPLADEDDELFPTLN